MVAGARNTLQLSLQDARGSRRSAPHGTSRFMFATLALPFTLRGGAIIPNRVALAPLTNQQSHDDGVLSQDERRWLVRRAEGGFGIVETCAAFVSPDGEGFDGQLGISSDAQLPTGRRRGSRCRPALQRLSRARRFKHLVADQGLVV
jgi:hypothetical protein